MTLRTLVITIGFLACGNLLALELELKSGSYYLVGSCAAAKKEIQVINNNSEPVCECSGDICKTELSSHLPDRISETLKHPNLKLYGPNCWNSVLYTLGLHQGLHFTDEDIKIWLASPLCKKIERQPLAGNIVHIRTIDPDSKYVEDHHTYRLISDLLAYNKSSPSIDDPYEIIKRDEYFERNKIPSECRFVSLEQAIRNNCESYSEAYDCDELSKIPNLLNKNETARELKLEVEELASISTEQVRSGQTSDQTVLTKRTLKVASLVQEKMQIREAYSILSLPLKSKIKELVFPTCDECHIPSEDDLFKSFVYLFILASPGMSLEMHSADFQELIQELRENDLYTAQAPLERLVWVSLFLSAMSLEAQFTVPEPFVPEV